MISNLRENNKSVYGRLFNVITDIVDGLTFKSSHMYFSDREFLTRRVIGFIADELARIEKMPKEDFLKEKRELLND